MRNYKAMNDSKLLQAITELQNGGEGRNREGDNWRAALTKARTVAAERGLTVTRVEPVVVDEEATGPPPYGPLADPMPKPMLAKSVPDVPADESSWVLEGKMDGWRTLVHHVNARSLRLAAGRNAADYSGRAAHVETAVARLTPKDTIVDGELLVPGQSSPRVGHALAHGGKDGGTPLIYVVFDVLRVAGNDIMHQQWELRRAVLEQMFEGFEDDEEKHSATIFLSPVATRNFQAAHEGFMSAGLEGSVAKRRSGRYVPGRRSDDTVKIKPQTTADALIVGIEQGKGESNSHLPGAFKLRLKNGNETSCKILTDELVAQVQANPDRFVHRVVEVKHHGETAHGDLRHPIFFRFRDDYDMATWVAEKGDV